jgi:hypothetical protein
MLRCLVFFPCLCVSGAVGTVQDPNGAKFFSKIFFLRLWAILSTWIQIRIRIILPD